MNFCLIDELLLFSSWPDIKLNKNDSEHQMFTKYFGIIDKENSIEVLRKLQNVEGKNVTKAKQLRTCGNAYYKDKEYENALDAYNESITFAPRDSTEFGLALANRSAVFFCMEKYKESLEDTNVVLKSEYPKDLLYKVFLRQSECYLKLNLNFDVANCLRRAQECVDNLKLSELQRTLINDRIKELKNQLKEHLGSNVCDNVSDEYVITESTLKDEENSKFLNASKVIDFKYTKKLGRHVVANTDIKKGDVLFIEEPYSYIPIKTSILKHNIICSCCLKKTLNRIPCTNCVSYLYCSDKCRQKEWDLGHRWECGARHLNYGQKLSLSMLFNATRDEFQTDVDDESVYGNRENNYPFINKLITNKNEVDMEKLNLFLKWAVCLVLYLKNFTDYFDWLYLRPVRPEGSKEDLLTFVGGQLVKYSLQINCNSVLILHNNILWDPVDFATMHQLISGLGIYASSSLLNHSCIPNSSNSFCGTKRIIKASKDIKKGSEITINYLITDSSEYKGTDERQKILKQFVFKCSCQMCIDPKYEKLHYEAYLCPRCSGRALLADNNIIGQCNECNIVFSGIEYNIIEKKIAELFVMRYICEDYDQFDLIYTLMKKIFHKSNARFLFYYDTYLEYFYKKGEIKKCVDKIRQRAEVCKNIHDDTSKQYILQNATHTYLLAKYSKTLRKQKSKYYMKYQIETKEMIKKCISIMESTMCTDDIKTFVIDITEYLNSDKDDIISVENDGFIIEQCD